MVVGAARIELRVHGSRSLKEKRAVVNAIRARLRGRFNISLAEVDAQDTWQRIVLGLATVANDASSARRRLEGAIDFVEKLHLAEVVEQEIETL